MDAETTILQVGAADTGGAARVMLDLHAEYRRRGLDSWVAVGRASAPAERVLEIPNEAARSGWARALRRVAGVGRPKSSPDSAIAKALLVAAEPRRYSDILSGREDFGYPATRSLLGLPPRTPGVLHLHNLHGYYFDLSALPPLSHQVPTALTMHDAWLLTGHCAHPFECTRWREGCGECPHLDIYVPIARDASATNWATKRDILKRSRLGLVSPSRWLFEMAEQTLPLGHDLRIRVIPNGVDTAVFHPADQREARAAVGLSPDARVLLASAEHLADNPFKDFPTLVAALSRIGEAVGPVTLLALGLDAPLEIDGVEIVAVPFERDLGRVARFYQAADIYVHAARAENLPLTVIEAMACGTAVVASNVGGIPELVRHGETGLLVAPGDGEALAEAVTALLSDPARRHAYGRAGAAHAAAAFSLEREADAYLDWYEELRELFG